MLEQAARRSGRDPLAADARWRQRAKSVAARAYAGAHRRGGAAPIRGRPWLGGAGVEDELELVDAPLDARARRSRDEAGGAAYPDPAGRRVRDAAAAALDPGQVVRAAAARHRRAERRHCSGVVSPPLPEALAERPRRPKRSKPWFEEIFDEDYLRTLPFMTPEQTMREVAFIEASLEATPARRSSMSAVATGVTRSSWCKRV